MSLVENRIHAEENSTAVDTVETASVAERFGARGLAKTVQRDEAEQIAREKKTRESEPESYRLSEYSEEFISARYRHGKELMSGEDLIEYIEETREMRIKGTDFSEVAAPDEETSCKPVLRTDATPNVKARVAALPGLVKALPKIAVERVKLSYPMWFDGAKADTRNETKRFPLSAFAALLAMAMSLSLVVASSVIIHYGESRLNTLKIELSDLSDEVAVMEADLNAKTDLLSIRDVATEEFGMVDEKFVRQEYLSENRGDSIVVYEQENEKTIGLSALLNALGIK